jgi:DNA-binding LytR/AlgR family response regulator
MRKIKCLIVDDEPLALDLIESYIIKTSALELTGRCSSAIEAMEYLDHENIDLIFLDVQMPELSGIEFSRTISNGPKIIFTTAFEKYALEGFKVNALDYLLKPFNYEEFLKSVTKAKEWFSLIDSQPNNNTEISDYIYIKSEYKILKITLAEVLYFEGLKDYVKIYLDGQSKPILSLMSLKSLEQQLPVDQFMRIHRSYIVNLNKIEVVERSRIAYGNTYIPIADNYKEKFNQYLSSKSIGL